MVDRHDEPRSGGVCHCDRLLRRAMGTDPWVIGADAHDCEIVRPIVAQAGEMVREGGIAGKNDAPSVALKDVAIVAAVQIRLHPRSPVFDRKCPNHNCSGSGPDFATFAPAQFGNGAQLCPAQEIAGARRGNDLRAGIEPPQRSPIDVIEMRVRKQNQIDRRQLVHGQCRFRQALRSDGGEWKRNPDPAEKSWIGQDRDAKEIQQDGRVTEPGRSQPLVRSIR